MRVTIIGVGTRGDVQPLVALATAMRDAGHIVKFAGEQIFADVIAKAGLEFHRLSGDSERFHAGPAGVAFRETLDRSPVAFRKFWNSFVAIGFRTHLREVCAPCEGADAVVSLPYLNIASTLAEKFGIPSVVAGVIPSGIFPTSAFPYPFNSRAADDMGPTRNLQSWRRAIPLLRIGYDAVQLWRQEQLGLSRQNWTEYRDAVRSMPHLLGVSPVLLPGAPEWNGNQRMTGFWFPNLSQGYEPPETLRHFLDAGDPPVLVGFGSHVGRNPGRLTQLVVDALKIAGKRAILISGWGALQTADLPPTIFGARVIPYDWLLPRVSAAVHHGGSGTMGICLKYGVPQVITPFGYDQMFWGYRIARLGVGTLPLEAKTMQPAELAEAIRQATETPAIVARAREVGLQVSAESGLQQAFRAIEAQVEAARVCAA